DVDDRVATITLNRPERHNALSQKLCAELVEVVRTADQDPSVRVLVITGAGGKAFSAGYDIKESAEAPKRTLSEWRDRLNRDLVYPQATLRQETMKLARRMSRVALAALQWNKRAVNNTLETMGFRAAMQYGVEACTILDATNTPEYAQFDEIRRTKGLAEALR